MKNLIDKLRIDSKRTKDLNDALEIVNTNIKEYITDIKTKHQLDSNTQEITNKISQIISLYYKADLKNSLSKFQELLEEYCVCNKNRLIETVQKEQIFFRMRTSNEYCSYSREDLFHVPFTQLENISKQRFSIDGFPCLYLGSSIYGCWSETRRPDLFKSHFAAFKNTKILKVYKAYYPNQIKTKNDIFQTIISFLCSIKVNNDNKSHKYEYVFPQLLLHCLRASNEDIEKPINIDGIKYLSSFYNDDNDLYKIKDILYNYIIPVQEIDKRYKYCKQLENLFRVSEVKALYKYKLQAFRFTTYNIRRNSYDQSLFSQIERSLGNFKYINNSKIE